MFFLGTLDFIIFIFFLCPFEAKNLCFCVQDWKAVSCAGLVLACGFCSPSITCLVVTCLFLFMNRAYEYSGNGVALFLLTPKLPILFHHWIDSFLWSTLVLYGHLISSFDNRFLTYLVEKQIC